MSNDPSRRFTEHKRSKCKSTKRFNGNVIMVYLERLEHRDKKTVASMAWKREKQIKKWGRPKKKNLIKIHRIRTAQLMRKYLN